MSFHPLAFNLSTIVANTLTAMNVVADAVFSRASDTSFFVPAGTRIIAAYVGSAAGVMTQARINSPGFLRQSYPQVRPLGAALLPGSDPNVAVFADRPPLYASSDLMGVDAESTGTTQVSAIIFAADKVEPIPQGESFWIRSSWTTTAVTANAWSTLVGTGVLLPQLPDGVYAVIGLEHISAAGIAARLILPGQTLRPGTISGNAATNRTARAFYEGELGLMGTYQAFAPPSIEVFCTGADTVHTVALRLIKIA